jgi:competence protein ComEA
LAAPGGKQSSANRHDSPSVRVAEAQDDGKLMKNGKVLSGKLNINTATEEQLTMLPGIGPKKAQRILDYRAKQGKFKRVRDLRRVKGFGYKTVTKLEPYLTVDGKTTLEAN